MRILALADTHNHLPAKLEELAAAADEVWHLGDVVAPSVLEKLRACGRPVTVVRGNCDVNTEWPLVVDVERCGVRVRLTHIPPSQPPENVDLLLHGHTHVPRDETRNGVRFLNPGCVTRPNRGAPASVAHLEISESGALRWELTRLR